MPQSRGSTSRPPRAAQRQQPGARPVLFSNTHSCAMWASKNTAMPVSGRGPLLTAAGQSGPSVLAQRLVGRCVSRLRAGCLKGVRRCLKGVRRCAGDWLCGSCGQHNFRSRYECYKCAAPKCVPRYLKEIPIVSAGLHA